MAQSGGTPAANTRLAPIRKRSRLLRGLCDCQRRPYEARFCGGMAVPAVVRYGYGFVQGAMRPLSSWATPRMSRSSTGMREHSRPATSKIKMDGWYSDGTEAVLPAAVAVCFRRCSLPTEANPKGWVRRRQRPIFISERFLPLRTRNCRTPRPSFLQKLYDNGGTGPHLAVRGCARASTKSVGIPTADAS